MSTIHRWNEEILKRALRTRRVVVISGARQCGKSTLLEMAFGGKVEIRSLDVKRLRDAALSDPQSFVANATNDPMVIDEIQKAPELLSEIKHVVDHDNRPGQYVVTGSSDVFAAPETKESLAGRIKNIRMRTFSQGEMRGTKPRFLERLFSNDFSGKFEPCDKRCILKSAICGGYPEVVAVGDAEDRRDWFVDYLNALLLRDIHDDQHIRRQQALRELLKAVAAFSSKYADTEKIMAACGVSRPTYSEYLNVLQRYYLCDCCEAWAATDYARIGKRSKWYMCDTGLMTALLNWREKDVILDPDRSGKLVESFVYTELVAQTELSRQYVLSHYRDMDKREIDFIVEDADGNLAGIEVKSGSAVGKEDFKHLVWFRDTLARGRKFVGIVLYAGSDVLSFGEGRLAVPISALWGE